MRNSIRNKTEIKNAITMGFNKNIINCDKILPTLIFILITQLIINIYIHIPKNFQVEK
jgi:ABC-type dipeptide/oligopeptide/nickel transport system permease subunit